MKLKQEKNISDYEYNKLVAQETLILNATEYVCEIMTQDGVTRTELAKRMGVTKGLITQLLSGERNLTLRTFSDMCFALNVKPAIKHGGSAYHKNES